MTRTYTLYQRLTARPGGRTAFSLIYSQAAPYFASVRPRVREVRPNHAEVVVAKRRAVQNHIGTVHAIAVCNGLEAAMGLLAEASVPDGMRWIPKGMDVRYIAKSDSDILCLADTDAQQWSGEGDLPVRVRAVRADGTTVVEGTIHLWVSPAKS